MSCDAELQELMAQVDKMVEQKKNEWDAKMKMSENKLTHYIEENGMLKHKLNEKCTEIDHLKHHFNYKESVPQITDYDENVEQLKSELSLIKKSYEKYQQKYIKKIKEMEKEKDNQTQEKLELLKQLNELKCATNKWKYEKAQLLEQIDELSMKKQEVGHDRELISEQLKLARLDYNEHKANWTELEQKYSAQIQKMQSSLEDAKDSFEREADESRQKVKEIMQQMKRTVEEKQQLLNDNESAKKMILKLENELARTSGLLKSKEKSVYKLEHSVQISERTISEKNDVIRILQSNSSSKDLESVKIKLESELTELRSQLKVSKRNEKSLHNETSNLQMKIHSLEEKILEQSDVTSEMDQKNMEVETKNRRLVKQVQEMEENVSMKDEELMVIKEELANVKKEVTFLRSSSNCNSLISKEGYKTPINCNKNSAYTEKASSKQKHLNFINTDEPTKENHVPTATVTSHHSEPARLVAPQREVDFLFKFCEEKDLVIQRLQMENQVLQEFITKINATMIDQSSKTNTTPFVISNKPPTPLTNRSSVPTSQSYSKFMSTNNNNNNNNNNDNNQDNDDDHVEDKPHMNSDMFRDMGQQFINNDTLTNYDFHTMQEVQFFTPDNSTSSISRTLKLSDFSDDDEEEVNEHNDVNSPNGNNKPESAHLNSILMPLNCQKPPLYSNSKSTLHNCTFKPDNNSQDLWNNIERSSGEFITNLSSSHDKSILKNSGGTTTNITTNLKSHPPRNIDINNNVVNDDSSVLQNLYPTLAAARYFSEERDRTRQLENIIDQHMVQLKQHTQQIVQRNAADKSPQDNYNS